MILGIYRSHLILNTITYPIKEGLWTLLQVKLHLSFLHEHNF